MNVLKPIGHYRWTICLLLFAATTINYLDRQVLSLLHPMLEEQFNWSNTDYANITAAFQFVYALSMLFAGRFVDRLGTKWGFAIAIIVWSVAAILHAYALEIGVGADKALGFFGMAGLSASVTGFIIVRAFLGVGESGNFPAAIKATAEYFPKKDRSLATGIFNSGATVGAIIAPLTVPWMALNWGWQSSFIAIGAVGFIWLIFWFWLYDKPERQSRLSAGELAYIQSDVEPNHLNENDVEEKAKKVAWFRLLTYRQTWSFTIGKFLTDGVWWFFLFWLPSYLKEEYGMTGTEIMIPLAVLYGLTIFGGIFGGWFPKYFIQKGYNSYDGRMKAMLAIALIPLLVLLAQPLGNISYWIPVILIGIGASAHQAWSANIFTTVSDMFPTVTVGAVVGIGGMAGGIGGVIISKLAGALFDYYDALGRITTGYTIMFAICAVSYLLAWIIMKALVPKMELVELKK